MAGFQYWCVLIRAKFEGIVTMPGLKRKKNAVYGIAQKLSKDYMIQHYNVSLRLVEVGRDL